MGKLQQISDLLDVMWEDAIFDPATALSTLFEVDNVDAKWLKFLKPILGFTADIPFSATTAELRRILRVAMDYWNKKPAEEGVIDVAIRMVTGNRFRASNYFDFRMQTGITVITEELEDFDPSVIAFFAPAGTYPVGSTIDLGQTGPREFELLGAGIKEMVSEDIDAYLILKNDGLVPTNDGIYQITKVLSGTTGEVLQTFPNPVTAFPIDWQILFYMDEFITEVRLVEPGRGTLGYDEQVTGWSVGEKVFGADSGANGIVVSDDNNGAEGTVTLRTIFGRFENDEALNGDAGGDGTAKGVLSGVLNRELIDYLIRTVLPMTERVNIVYINFLDQFLQPTDLDQWTLSDADLITVPSPGGEALVAAGENMIDADTEGATWGDQTTAWKVEGDSASSIVRCLFMATDVDNGYVAQLDYGARELKLFERTAAADTQLGSTIAVPVVLAGVQDVIRVDALAEGADTRIRVKLNGETRIDVADSPSTYTAGRVGFQAVGDQCRLKTVEVNVLPAEIQRVGLNP